MVVARVVVVVVVHCLGNVVVREIIYHVRGGFLKSPPVLVSNPHSGTTGEHMKSSRRVS